MKHTQWHTVIDNEVQRRLNIYWLVFSDFGTVVLCKGVAFEVNTIFDKQNFVALENRFRSVYRWVENQES